jgi:uncharacterized membrane protein YqjE
MPQSTVAKGFGEELTGTFASARMLLSNVLDLFTLEARRAGLSLLLMLACGIIGALLAAAAWLGLMAALVLWAVALGADWQVALAAVAVGNLGAAAALFWYCLRVSRNLLFPATRRQLRPTRIAVVPE